MNLWLYIWMVKIYLNALKCPRRGLALIRMWNICKALVSLSSFFYALSLSMLLFFSIWYSAAISALLVTMRNSLLSLRVLTELLWMLQGCLHEEVPRRDRLLLHQLALISLFYFLCFLVRFCLKKGFSSKENVCKLY